jgi:hypothetical protein
MGYTEGENDFNDGSRNVTVILDFGQVGWESGASGYDGYGAYNFDAAAGYPFEGDGGIGALVNAFAYGWYIAVGSTPHLELGVGEIGRASCRERV